MPKNLNTASAALYEISFMETDVNGEIIGIEDSVITVI